MIVAEEADPALAPAHFGPYLRRNAGVALALAATVGAGSLAAERTREALAGAPLGGRLQLLDGAPPLLIDAAHNEEGARALAEAIAPLGRPRIACMAVRADKDATAIAAADEHELAGGAAAVAAAIAEEVQDLDHEPA